MKNEKKTNDELILKVKRINDKLKAETTIHLTMTTIEIQIKNSMTYVN